MKSQVAAMLCAAEVVTLWSLHLSVAIL